MKIDILLKNSFKTIFEQHINDGKRAVTEVIKEGTQQVLDTYRGQIRSGFRSRKLPTTWQKVMFPARGESMGAAGKVFSRAPEIISYWTLARTVRSRGHKFLAVPTQYNIAPGGRFGQKRVRITPRQLSQTKGDFILPAKRSGNYIWCLPTKVQTGVSSKGRRTRTLVAGSLQVRGGKRFGSTIRSIKEQGFVPMFVLFRQASFEKKIDLQGPVAKVDRQITDAIVSRWKFNYGKPAKSFNIRGAF